MYITNNFVCWQKYALRTGGGRTLLIPLRSTSRVEKITSLLTPSGIRLTVNNQLFEFGSIIRRGTCYKFVLRQQQLAQTAPTHAYYQNPYAAAPPPNLIIVQS
jgi:hypothetical protein